MAKIKLNHQVALDKKHTRMTKPSLQVILTPAIAHLYDMKGSCVVVVDILRATTSMCFALHNGAKSIIPVQEVEEAEVYRLKGFAVAAERNGIQLEGFAFGNSPFSFTPAHVKGKEIVFTTTNGTKCIQKAKDERAEKILLGSFLNLDALIEELSNAQWPLFIFCAGWKEKFNLEDTLFAGALVASLRDYYTIEDDSSEAAEDIYKIAKDNLEQYVQKASHSKRFDRLGIVGDAPFCVKLNLTRVIPELVGDRLIVKKT